ncbi:MAG: hypothetical protein J4F28_09030 [Nitrosopumilaceae archaeon]|nr:hypothetical protein [Nitrosopumilaceae archaeon]
MSEEDDRARGAKQDHALQLRTELSKLASSNSSEFVARFGGAGRPATYVLRDVTVSGPPPERDVPARGSDEDNRTYFTKSPICRINCSTRDASILDEVTPRMLGPRTDFAAVQVDIRTASGRVAARLVANVTGSVEVPSESRVHLVLVVVDVVDSRLGSSMGHDELRNIAKTGLKNS